MKVRVWESNPSLLEKLGGFLLAVKMSCLCAPTTHAGSFRCRLHRPQQSWGGRPMPCRPASEECLQAIEADTVSESSVPIAIPVDQSFQPMVPVATSLPSSPRSPSRGLSRLQRMTSSDELMGLVANTTE